jgi:hypothetical protein
MDYILLNIGAILAATAAGLGVGLVHLLLVRPRPRPGAWLAPLALVAEFWLAAILAGALILAPPLAAPWVIAVVTAIVIWIGFVAPALLVTLRFRGLPGQEAAADSLHWLLVMLVQAVVLQAIGLSAPLKG